MVKQPMHVESAAPAILLDEDVDEEERERERERERVRYVCSRRGTDRYRQSTLPD